MVRTYLMRFEICSQGQEEEIGFLRSHVGQLTQSISQLALKPVIGNIPMGQKVW